MQTAQTALWVVALLVFMAIAFDFMNGFHDAANSIATVVSTGVLKPGHAVAFAALFNLLALFVFHLRTCSRSSKQKSQESEMDELQTGIEMSLAVFP